MTKVINLIGAPSSGKSTVAAGLFYTLKKMGYNVEYSSEWVKTKVYEQAPYPFHDQLYTFAKQNKQLRQLVGKVDYIVTDSPLLVSLVYNSEEPELFNKLVLEYFNQYDNVVFYLDRTHKFQQEGRIHNEDEADEVGKKMKAVLDDNNIQYIETPSEHALDVVLAWFDAQNLV